jgi:hypothetical protein
MILRPDPQRARQCAARGPVSLWVTRRSRRDDRRANVFRSHVPSGAQHRASPCRHGRVTRPALLLPPRRLHDHWRTRPGRRRAPPPQTPTAIRPGAVTPLFIDLPACCRLVRAWSTGSRDRSGINSSLTSSVGLVLRSLENPREMSRVAGGGCRRRYPAAGTNRARLDLRLDTSARPRSGDEGSAVAPCYPTQRIPDTVRVFQVCGRRACRGRQNAWRSHHGSSER